MSQYFDVRMNVIPNGIDIDVFRPGRPPVRGLRDGKVNVLFVGRLEKRKGLRYLLRAYEYMRERVPESRLVIVGDGPLRSSIEGFVAGRGLEDVVIAGYVPAEDLPSYYASADVFCAPATGAESFGIVLLEAMASGLPVVTTEIPGYLTVVDPGQNALTVRPKSWQELGATLVVLARDAELRRRMGASGLAKAQRYSWREVTARVIEVYEQARAQSSAHLETRRVHDALPGLD